MLFILVVCTWCKLDVKKRQPQLALQIQEGGRNPRLSIGVVSPMLVGNIRKNEKINQPNL